MSTRIAALLVPLLACSAGELEENAGRGALGRPIEACQSDDCRTQPQDSAMSEVVHASVQAAREDRPAADPGKLPERPSLRRRSMSGVDASEDIGTLDEELDSLPVGAPEIPAMLLRLAIAHRDSGNEREMKDTLLRILRDHPTSELAPHVYLALGDFYREEGGFENALKLYSKSTMFPDSRVAALAHYLEAWCWLDMPAADGARALESFVKAINHAPTGLATDHDGFVTSELVDAALRDLERAYFEVGQPAKFVAFYTRLVPDDAEGRTTDACTRLGSAYEAAGQTAESVSLCTALTARWPDADCSWQ